nr:hypothetical protein [Tanacetum cinerariifolium]
MTKAEQMKLAIKRSLQQTHISQASGSGADEGTGIITEVPDVPTDESDEEISWKSSDEDDDDVDDQSDVDDDDDDQEDEDEQDDNDDDQDTDNEDDDFVHTKLFIREEEAKDEESFDPIVQTSENSDDEGNDDASLGMNVSGEEGQDAKDDDEELYKDVNINLEDDDKLYKFKEGDFKRLYIQDIKDMLLLLVQGKLRNLTVKERFAFNVLLRMFTKSIAIQRRAKDLQLGVESYQKKLNLTKPDTYRSDLKRKEAYTAYSNPIGFIYHNKDKQNRLMRINELHKFSDGMLNDV